MSWIKSLMRPRIQHPNPVYFYTQGERFGPGAEGLAFDTVYLNPLKGIGGIIHGPSIRVHQPPQIYQSLALPVQPLIAGVQAGGLYNQALNQINTGIGDDAVQ